MKTFEIEVRLDGAWETWEVTVPDDVAAEDVEVDMWDFDPVLTGSDCNGFTVASVTEKR